jgi:hypothetical protein
MNAHGDKNPMRAEKHITAGRSWLVQGAPVFLIAVALTANRHVAAAEHLPRYKVFATSASGSATNPDAAIIRTAGWPFGPRQESVYGSAQSATTPHPAVVRIIAPEQGATAYGSGTLIDVGPRRAGHLASAGRTRAIGCSSPAPRRIADDPRLWSRRVSHCHGPLHAVLRAA